MWAVHS